jgi:hypothetical protein
MQEDEKTRRPAEIGEPISRRTPEERKLPRGYVAVVSEISPELQQYNTGAADFIVQIGRVLYKSPDALSHKEKKSGTWIAATHVSIPEGEHAGDMLILPISDGPTFGEKYAISVWNMPDSKEVRLKLHTIDLKQTLMSSRAIDASVFKDHGFDLDPKNPNNLGKQLDSHLAQDVFYDFLVGHGAFAAEGKLIGRRTLTSQRSSKDTVHPYIIPTIVETDRENKYNDLMWNYFLLASALSPRSEIRKLEEHKAKQKTAYCSADASTRRDMEASLKMEFNLLQENGFERTLNIVERLMIDDEQPEAEVYHMKEERRIAFASTKYERKIDMLLQLIELKQKMADVNLERYLEICNRMFPTGPRAKTWGNRARNATSQMERAEVSEVLKNELEKRLTSMAHDHSEEWRISSIDTGMSAEEAADKINMRIQPFEQSPLSIKADIAADLEIRANAALLAAFTINIKVLEQLFGEGEKDEREKIENDYKNAPLETKIRIARELLHDVQILLEKQRAEYESRSYKALRNEGKSKGEATEMIHQAVQRLSALTTKNQLQAMNTNNAI